MINNKSEREQIQISLFVCCFCFGLVSFSQQCNKSLSFTVMAFLSKELKKDKPKTPILYSALTLPFLSFEVFWGVFF